MIKRKVWAIISYSASVIETIVEPSLKYLEMLTLEGSEILLKKSPKLGKIWQELIQQLF